MLSRPEPLLKNHRIFHSRNADETRAFLAAKEYRFDPLESRPRELDVHLNGIYLPHMYIGFATYGRAPVTFSPGKSRSDHWIQLPISGTMDAVIGGEEVCSTPACAVALSPVREDCRFLSVAGNARIQLALSDEALNEHLAALLGQPVREPLDISPNLGATGFGQRLRRSAMQALAAIDRGDMGANASSLAIFQEFAMTGLLLFHPHNFSAALSRLSARATPRDVKRATDYIHDHISEPISLTHILAVSGVPGRTLFQHFRDHKGVSPVQYLRNTRFQKVRDTLTHAEPCESVTTIAMNWGFSHLGRFAIEYRQRFGEKPSDTLRRRPPFRLSGSRSRSLSRR